MSTSQDVRELQGVAVAKRSEASEGMQQIWTVSAPTGRRDLFGNADPEAFPRLRPAGLSSVSVTSASIVGICADLGERPHTVLCLDIRGAEGTADNGRQRDSMDIVMVIDTSGSMNSVISQVQETCMQVFTELISDDRISLVSFSTEAVVILPMTRKADVDDFAFLCGRLRADGGTNIEAGLRKGIAQLAQTSRTNSGVALAIVLSDGSPNGGATQTDALCAVAGDAAILSGRAVTIHSFGFTQNHRIDLMSTLPQASNGSIGSYYYLGVEADMPAAVGDCLGAGMAIRPCRDLRAGLNLSCDADVSAEVPVAWWYGPESDGSRHHSKSADDSDSDRASAPLLGLRPPDSFRVAALQACERQIAVFVVPPHTVGATISLAWDSDVGAQFLEAHLELSQEPPRENANLLEGKVPKNLEALTVTAHVLRLQVAAALAALAVCPCGSGLLDGRFDVLHGSVVQALASLQTLSEDVSGEDEVDGVFLEGMLQTLERDLGEAVASRDHGAEFRGVLLSFSAEHFAMRSASSLTRVRTSYATRHQIQTRLRFLQCSVAGSANEKAICEVAEADVSVEEQTCRRALETQSCYVTLSSWRECVLGLGLFVHPRTCRERRAGIPAEVDLVVDYVSAEAYNLGVRTMVHHAATTAESGDSDNEVLATITPPEVLKSSCRLRINAWLPLYINAANWALAKTFAPSAFSLIATQLNAVFRPDDALKVCARLLCCAVVGFVRTEEGWRRAGASERAVQMYCDVHRLFLRMAEDYPVIRKMALDHVRGFVESPQKRTRKATSDLGLLMTYLSILDEVDWKDLCEVFVPEMVRRAFARMREPLRAENCESEMSVISRFDDLEPEHGRVILFFKIFNSLVARPLAPWDTPVDAHGTSALPIADVCTLYDRGWGQLPADRCDAVLREVKRVRSLNSVSDVLRELLPFDFSNGDVCELLLWASHHGSKNKVIEQWLPMQAMQRTFTHAWQNVRELRFAFEREAQQLLIEGLSPFQGVNRLLSLAKTFNQAQRTQFPNSSLRPPSQSRFRYSCKEEACAAATRARAHASGTRIAKGDAKGHCISAGAELNFKPAQRSQGHFNLVVILSDAMAALAGRREKQFILQRVSYTTDQGKLASGRDLRSTIAAETSLDARQMKIVVRGAPRSVSGAGVCSAISNSAVLIDWQFDTPGAAVEVLKKERGGKKPGNGWHAVRSFGRTYPMCIASAIVRDTVFTKADQYFTIVEGDQCLSSMLRLCVILQKHAIVLCGGGIAITEQQAISYGCKSERTTVDGAVRLTIGNVFVFLVAESDAPEQQPLTLTYEMPEPELPVPLPREPGVRRKGSKGIGKGGGKGGKSGQTGTLSNQVEDKLAHVAVPAEASDAGLIFVLDGQELLETASLASVICQSSRSVRDSVSPVSVFHLVTNIRQAMLETEEQLSAVMGTLSEASRMNKLLELPGLPRFPEGALLLPQTTGESCTPLLPPAASLPAVIRFELRFPTMGFVTRLQESIGCSVMEVYYKSLLSVMGDTCGPKHI